MSNSVHIKCDDAEQEAEAIHILPELSSRRLIDASLYAPLIGFRAECWSAALQGPGAGHLQLVP